MEHHNRAPEGTQRLFRYLSGFFRVPCDFEDAVYLMQLAQGEAVKMGVEFWRSRKLLTAGALFWQLNDCWPVTSWSCLDYEGRPKALYYYARRFYAPLLPVIDFRDGRFAVTVVNDSPSDFQGRIVCGFGHVSGDQKWVQQDAVSVPANSLAVVRTKDASELPPAEPEEHYFWCRLLKDRQEVAKNAWFLLPYKHVEFEPPEWEVNVHQAGPCAFGVDLRCSTFAKGVWLRVHGVEAQFSDNFLDVFAEVPARVEIRTAEPLEPEELRRRLRIRSVAEAQAAGATRA
jgi:beta-mannosidase